MSLGHKAAWSGLSIKVSVWLWRSNAVLMLRSLTAIVPWSHLPAGLNFLSLRIWEQDVEHVRVCLLILLRQHDQYGLRQCPQLMWLCQAHEAGWLTDEL